MDQAAHPFDAAIRLGVHEGEFKMKRLVQYTLKADRVGENERHVEQVFAELREVQPPGLHYASLRLADGVSFMHLVSYDGLDSDNPLPRLASFKAFVAGIRERCAVAPVTTELHEIGNYRLFDTDTR
jgi:hypothetical protein